MCVHAVHKPEAASLARVLRHARACLPATAPQRSATQDVYKTQEQIRAAGGTVTREAGPVPGIGTKIVACTDPDGWKIVFVDEQARRGYCWVRLW